MTEYFYQIGGSLASDAPTYVERPADRQLYQALIQGEFCYVFNSRQMGKSSLLVHTRKCLEEQGYVCNTIDITKIGSENITPLQWYKGIVTELWRGFNLMGKFPLKSWWQEAGEISLSQKLSEFIDQVILENVTAEKIFIFVDEIDSILGLDFPVDDFFALIRFCYNQRANNPAYHRLSFALFGVATPNDLIQDKSRTPFNIGTAVDLGGFTLEQAQPLLPGLSDRVSHPENVLKEILAWTNGQPFLTQKLCNLVTIAAESMAEGLNIPPGTEAFWVDNLVNSQVIQHWESQDEPEHLRTIRDRILHNQKKAGRLLGIYQQILEADIPQEYPPKPPLRQAQGIALKRGDDFSSFLREKKGAIESDNSREQTELILSGLVVKYQEYLQVKNKIYQEVFNQEWVAKQLSALRPYSQTFDAWVASGQTDESRLLRGKALKEAQIWAQGQSLSDLDYQFLAASVDCDKQEVQRALEAERSKAIEAEAKAIAAQLAEEKRRLCQEQKTAKLQRVFLVAIGFAFMVASGLGLFAFKQYREARINEIQALTASSESLLLANRQLDAMVAAIKAKRKLEHFSKGDRATRENVENVLNQAVYGSYEFNRLNGHKGSVPAVNISPNLQLIATGAEDQTVRIWQADGKLLHILKHSGAVWRVMFSPDSRLLVAASLDGTVKIWRVDGTLIKSFKAHEMPVWGVAFSPNGQLIASASGDRTVKLWNLDGQLLKTFIGHQNIVRNVTFSPDSLMIASAGSDKTIKVWSVDGSLLNTLEGHEKTVWDVKFCPGTDLLVSISHDLTAKLWKIDGTLVKTIPHHRPFIMIDCQKKNIKAIDEENTIKYWNFDGKLIQELNMFRSQVGFVAMSANGLMEISANNQGQIKLWKLNHDLLKSFTAHQNTIWDVATSPDGKLIASTSVDETLKLWRSDGTLLQTLKDNKSTVFRTAVFSQDSRMLVTGSVDQQVQIWDISNPETSEIKLLKTLAEHKAAVNALAIAPDGKTIASGDNQTIRLWNFEGKLLHSFPAHNQIIWRLGFSPDGQFIASASADGTAKIWQTDGSLVATLNHDGPVWGVAFSPQGNFVVTSSRDGNLKLWELDGTLLKTIPNLSGLNRLAISPDGKIIATAGVDTNVKLWSNTGELLATLPGHQSMVFTVDFTADGNFLVSGGEEGTMIIWNLKNILTLNSLSYACNWVQDYLHTNAELEDGDRALCKGVELGEKND